ncbi:MAG: sugar ABC transporter substrate-binding protein [bacterium]|nr:sugar ABC transporter substrate-binding protein [bacterium]
MSKRYHLVNHRRTKIPRKSHARLIVSFSLSILVAISSCGGPPKRNPNELTFGYWSSVTDKSLIEETIANFEQLHPGVKIKGESTPWVQYFNKMLVRFVAETAPDVIMTSTERVSGYIEAEVLVDLMPFIQNDTTFSLADYYPELIERMSNNGKLYVLPRDIDVIACVFYNKDMFKKEGIPFPHDDWTWAEFLDASLKCTKDFNHDGKIDQWGVSIYGFIDAFIYSNGGTLVDDWRHPTRCTFDDPRTIEAVKFWQDLMYTYKVMPTGVTLSSLGMSEPDLFFDGKMGMFIAGIWMTPTFSKITAFDWDVVMIPRGPSGERRFIAEGSGYSMTKFCQNRELAWEFIKYLGGKEGQTILSRPGLTQPALMSLARSTVFLNGQKPANRKVVVEAAKLGMYRPATAKWDEVEQSYWQPMLDRIMSADAKLRIPADIGLKEVTEKVNKEIFKIPSATEERR